MSDDVQQQRDESTRRWLVAVVIFGATIVLLTTAGTAIIMYVAESRIEGMESDVVEVGGPAVRFEQLDQRFPFTPRPDGVLIRSRVSLFFDVIKDVQPRLIPDDLLAMQLALSDVLEARKMSPAEFVWTAEALEVAWLKRHQGHDAAVPPSNVRRVDSWNAQLEPLVISGELQRLRAIVP